MSRMAVIGAGAWGATFARIAALAGMDVTLACHTAAQAAVLGETRRDARHLGDVALPDAVRVTHVDDPTWLDGAQVVVIALPSRAVGDMAPVVAAGPIMPRRSPRASRRRRWCRATSGWPSACRPRCRAPPSACT